MLIGILLLLAALSLLLWLFLVFPRVSQSVDMSALRGDYAHRGLWNEQIPENSLAAFSLALREGYGIELDLQRTRDGQVVIFHDETLRRMCGIDARVSDLTLAELRRLRLKGTNEIIPTLAEVLSLVRGRVPLMIEIKGEKADPRLLLPASELLDTYEGPFCVESFSPLILSWFKGYRPGFARGQLVTQITSSDRKGNRLVNFMLSHLLLNLLSRPDFLSVRGDLRHRPVLLLLHKLMKRTCFVWTVRSAADYRACRKEGFFTVFEGIRPPKKRN